MTRRHAPRIDVREMASNNNSEEYLPTLINGSGRILLQSFEFPTTACGKTASRTGHPQKACRAQLVLFGRKNQQLNSRSEIEIL